MAESVYDRRRAENEVVFRQFNEQAKHHIKKTTPVTTKDDHSESNLPNSQDDMVIQFFCECSDENCDQRMQLSVKEYEHNHLERDYFTILPGHNVPEIEEVIKTEDHYIVVKKHEQPPDVVTQLNET